jgi:sulfonate transport system permease protein
MSIAERLVFRELVRRPGPAELRPREHARKQRTLRLVLGIGVPAVLVSLWQLASSRGWIDNSIYPGPSDIVSHAREMSAHDELWPDLLDTTRRIAVGLVAGVLVGVVVGMAMGMSSILRAAFEPLLNALYTVPKLALLGVYLIIFKYGEAPIYALVITTVFFFVWISTLEAMLSVPEGYIDAARSLRASRWQMFRHVLLPACLQPIFVGIRITAGVAVLVVIAVEFSYSGTSGRGIGHIIIEGKTLFIPEQTYVGIVVAALLGLGFIGIADLARRIFVPWAKRDRTIGQR